MCLAYVAARRGGAVHGVKSMVCSTSPRSSLSSSGQRGAYGGMTAWLGLGVRVRVRARVRVRVRVGVRVGVGVRASNIMPPITCGSRAK